MFLHFKNANTVHYKKSLYSIVVQKNVHKMSSVHGSSVLTVIMQCKDHCNCLSIPFGCNELNFLNNILQCLRRSRFIAYINLCYLICSIIVMIMFCRSYLLS